VLIPTKRHNDIMDKELFVYSKFIYMVLVCFGIELFYFMVFVSTRLLWFGFGLRYGVIFYWSCVVKCWFKLWCYFILVLCG